MVAAFDMSHLMSNDQPQIVITQFLRCLYWNDNYRATCFPPNKRCDVRLGDQDVRMHFNTKLLGDLDGKPIA